VAKRAVLWTDTARLDLQSLLEYIAEQDRAAAVQLLDRIERKALTLEALSQRGRIVAELRDVGVMHYRELIERPWRIVYRLDGSRILVLAILDSRRDLQSLLLERLIRS
jgi:plasmid stabilization system protein ParE